MLVATLCGSRPDNLRVRGRISRGAHRGQLSQIDAAVMSIFVVFKPCLSPYAQCPRFQRSSVNLYCRICAHSSAAHPQEQVSWSLSAYCKFDETTDPTLSHHGLLTSLISVLGAGVRMCLTVILLCKDENRTDLKPWYG